MSNYTTKLVLRKPTELQRFYRSLEILVSLFNHTVRPIIIPLQSLIGNFSVFCNVTLITEWTKMDGVLKIILSVWAIIALFSWGPILHFGRRFHANSCATVKSWKFFEWPKKEKKHLSKFRKSCRPLGIRVEEVYGQLCMRKLSVLKFMKGICKGTFGAILALE
jgi:hypothetical protein